MILSPAACSLLLMGAEATPAPSAAAAPLPRSSIAAVIAQRGALGLTDAEVADLEKRDDALQKQLDEIRDQLAASSRPSAGSRRSAPSDRGSLPLSPYASALPEGAGRGAGRGGGRRGGGSGAQEERDPAARASQLHSRFDDADTVAWLSAETVLAESRREKARGVAARYREQLADRREAERARQKTQ